MCILTNPVVLSETLDAKLGLRSGSATPASWRTCAIYTPPAYTGSLIFSRFGPHCSVRVGKQACRSRTLRRAVVLFGGLSNLIINCLLHLHALVATETAGECCMVVISGYMSTSAQYHPRRLKFLGVGRRNGRR